MLKSPLQSITTSNNSLTFVERVSDNYGTRGDKATLHVARVRTEAGQKSLGIQSPFCFNELPVHIRSLDPVFVFKHRLNKHLLGFELFT